MPRDAKLDALLKEYRRVRTRIPQKEQALAKAKAEDRSYLPMREGGWSVEMRAHAQGLSLRNARCAEGVASRRRT